MMPSSNEISSDEYVAKLLSEDARNSSIKYSSMGLSALLPKRPTKSAPKPNTRFLQSILRETDSHNAALKKKEELEARIRLQDMRSVERRVEAEGRQRKRRHIDDDEDEGSARNRKRWFRSHDEDERRPKRRDIHGQRSSQKSKRDDVQSSDDYGTREKRRRSSPLRGRDGTRRSSTPERHRRRRRQENSTSRSRSPHRRQSQRHRRDHLKEEARTHRRRRSPRPPHAEHSSRPPGNGRRKDLDPSRAQEGRQKSPGLSPATSSSSSDPLESIVGPLPPPQAKPSQTTSGPPPLTSRGRGAYRPSSSNIDSHFSTTYDPTLDLHPRSSSSPSPRREDWDMALEALRDREIWRRKGAARLREAGFGEEEVRKWEENSTTAGGREKEKAVEDVRWKGRGEEREWDLGKAVGKEEQQEEGGGRRSEVGLEGAWRRKGRGGGFGAEMRRALG